MPILYFVTCIGKAYCCLVYIYKWPIIVLYILPNIYCVDMTFLYGLLCVMIHIFFFKSSYSSQVTQVIPSQDELVRRKKLFCPNRGSNKNRNFERKVHHLVKLI